MHSFQFLGIIDKTCCLHALNFSGCVGKPGNLYAGGQFYNADTQAIETWYQAPLIPILAYRLEF